MEQKIFSGREIVRELNQHGLSARLIENKILISPVYRLTPALSDLVRSHRDELAAFLCTFGLLNQVDTNARFVSYERWRRSIPLSAYNFPPE